MDNNSRNNFEITLMKYPNEFIAHTAFCSRKWSPINSETYWCLYTSRSRQKIHKNIYEKNSQQSPN